MIGFILGTGRSCLGSRAELCAQLCAHATRARAGPHLAPRGRASPGRSLRLNLCGAPSGYVRRARAGRRRISAAGQPRRTGCAQMARTERAERHDSLTSFSRHSWRAFGFQIRLGHNGAAGCEHEIAGVVKSRPRPGRSTHTHIERARGSPVSRHSCKQNRANQRLAGRHLAGAGPRPPGAFRAPLVYWGARKCGRDEGRAARANLFARRPIQIIVISGAVLCESINLVAGGAGLRRANGFGWRVRVDVLRRLYASLQDSPAGFARSPRARPPTTTHFRLIADTLATRPLPAGLCNKCKPIYL